MINRRFLLGLLLWLAVAPLLPAAEMPEDLQATFSKAVALMQQKQFAEALPLLREVTQKAPDRPGGFWNLGLAATALGEKQLALDAWLQYRVLMPDDPRGMAKAIEGYQALGMATERDAQREEIRAYRASLPESERAKMPLYVRDQFDAAGMHFVVIEYFEPSAPYRHLYRFNAVDASQKTVYFFALESHDSTTAVAREMHEIGPDERIYSIDRYETGKHATYAMMKVAPSYDVVRALVLDAIEGRRRPTSSSTR